MAPNPRICVLARSRHPFNRCGCLCATPENPLGWRWSAGSGNPRPLMLRRCECWLMRSRWPRRLRCWKFHKSTAAFSESFFSGYFSHPCAGSRGIACRPCRLDRFRNCSVRSRRQCALGQRSLRAIFRAFPKRSCRNANVEHARIFGCEVFSGTRKTLAPMERNCESAARSQLG